MDTPEKLKRLKAFFGEAADQYLLGYGDELASALESLPVDRSVVVPTPGYVERVKENLASRQAARTAQQDAMLGTTAGGALLGMLASPAARVATAPARVLTSAIEEVGRSDPQNLVDLLKSLGIGAGQGALQAVAPALAAGTRKRSAAKDLLVPTIDIATSNIAPGIEREQELRRMEKERRGRPSEPLLARPTR